jgi:hypothetical protein
MTGQAWLQVAGFFAVAIPALMLLTHLVGYLAKGFTAPATEALKTPIYTDFGQIRKDLLAGVPIEEILDRCNGHIPEKGFIQQGKVALTPKTPRERLEEIRAEMLKVPLPPEIIGRRLHEPPIRF